MSVSKRMKQSGVLRKIVDASRASLDSGVLSTLKANPEFLKGAKTPQIIAERVGFLAVPAGGSYLGYKKLKNRKSGAESMPTPMYNSPT